MPEPLSPLAAVALTWALAVLPVQAPAGYADREFPVVGATDYVDAHHDYPATDVFADCGARVVSPVNGTVLEVNRTDRWDPATDLGRDRGGLSFSVEGVDGVRYYGSHLARLRGGLGPGDAVESGEYLGEVGRTGSARPTPCHLHVGISPVCDGTGGGRDWVVRRGTVSPYRYLRSWESGGNMSPLPAVSRWEEQHGCPGRP